MSQIISVNDLPRHSPWPGRLLGLDSFLVAEKSSSNVMREYNEDKWGAMSKLFDQHEIGDVDALEAIIDAGAPPIACLANGDLHLMTVAEARRRYVEEIASRLAPFAEGTALVEFGCGYGAMLLRLAQRKPFSALPIVGTEFAPNGVEIFNRLASRMGIPFRSGPCDLTQRPLTSVAIPKGALLCTIMTLPCLQEIDQSLFRALAAYEPAVVCHFEPIVEHADRQSLLGLMTHRYNEFNFYARGIPAALAAAERAGILEIVHEEKCFFGLNPLLPVSLLAWRPKKTLANG